MACLHPRLLLGVCTHAGTIKIMETTVVKPRGTHRPPCYHSKEAPHTPRFSPNQKHISGRNYIYPPCFCLERIPQHLSGWMSDTETKLSLSLHSPSYLYPACLQSLATSMAASLPWSTSAMASGQMRSFTQNRPFCTEQPGNHFKHKPELPLSSESLKWLPKHLESNPNSFPFFGGGGNWVLIRSYG